MIRPEINSKTSITRRKTLESSRSTKGLAMNAPAITDEPVMKRLGFYRVEAQA